MKRTGLLLMVLIFLCSCEKEELGTVTVSLAYKNTFGSIVPDIGATIHVFEGYGLDLEGDPIDWKIGTVKNKDTGKTVISIHSAVTDNGGVATIKGLKYGQYYFSLSSKGRNMWYGRRVEVKAAETALNEIFE